MSSSLSLYIRYNECNSESLTTFDMSAFKLIKSIKIGNDNFFYAKAFLFYDLLKLQHLTVGSNSFTQTKNSYGYDKSKSFHILNCESLESIQIGRYSFSDFGGEFELKNLPQLQSIQIGSYHIFGSVSYSFVGSLFLIRGIELIVNTE